MLEKVKILSTRPLSAPLLREAERAGISIESLSFIYTEPVRDEPVREEIRARLGQVATVVFTSMNAAEAVGEELDGVQPEWRIYCMGNATSRIVQRYFTKSEINGTAANASLLADLVINSDPENVIFFCGDQRRDELPAKLAAKNISFREVVVYRTKTTPHKVRDLYDGFLFFSPSAVRSFFAVNTVPAKAVLFAIGSTTAACIALFCRNKIVTGDLPGKEALAKLAIDYFDKINHT